MQTTAQSLIERASKYDPVLAADIRAFAKSREYGLIFEHNRPEAMRLYGKKIAKGDLVHILAERGKQETADNRVPWRVMMLYDDKAIVQLGADEDTAKEVAVSDLVSVTEYDQPIYAGLRETGRVERGGDKPYQVVINGENYHALESLLYAYEGRVDCVYIDPPYNTGAKDWKYNNDYVDGTDAYRHSKWLAFMERRLKLARKLLNPNNSVLVVTIDEKEYLRLGLLLEQMFPEAGIQMITDMINPSGAAHAQMFSKAEEYIYYVFLGKAEVVPSLDDMIHELKKEKPVRWDGLARRGVWGTRDARPNQFYPIFFSSITGECIGAGKPLQAGIDRRDVECPPNSFAVFPIAADGRELIWGLEPKSFEFKRSKGYIKFGPWKKGQTTRGIYHLQNGNIDLVESGQIKILGQDENGTLVLGPSSKSVRPLTMWNRKSHSASDYAVQMLQALIPGHRFSYPKSLYAVEDTLRFFVANKPNALVVDFFSGSGTTAHAIMRLNHQDGGQRKCICVTNNEVGIDEQKKFVKRDLRQGDSDWERFGICEYITKPRVRSAITGQTPDGNPVKGDYKFVDEFPMSDGFEENAVFFDLTYEDPKMVDIGEAFENIAPLLWMRAGSRGSIIAERGDDPTYATADTYAILFDYAYVKEYVEHLKSHPELQTVYVVTDDEGRYKSVCKEFPERDVVRLYESYLRSFQIAAEGALS